MCPGYADIDSFYQTLPNIHTRQKQPGDVLIDGGNEWFPNSVRRAEELAPKGILFMGMGISGAYVVYTWLGFMWGMHIWKRFETGFDARG